MPIDENYNTVAQRLVELREKYPDASLQPVNPKEPYTVVTIGDKTFVVYVAACYRTPTDRRPGIGTAWEPFPGPTNFTRDSELQNAETSAWGRAIVAALAADTRKGVASAEEVQNRSGNDRTPLGTRVGPVKGPEEVPTRAGNTRRGPRVLEGFADIDAQRAAHDEYEAAGQVAPESVREAIKAWRQEQGYGYPMTRDQLTSTLIELERLLDAAKPVGDPVLVGAEDDPDAPF